MENRLKLVLLLCLVVRSLEISGDTCKNDRKEPILLNGHYVRFSSQKTGEDFVEHNRYIPKNMVFTRFQLCADNVYLTAPRYRHGVPFTLGTTSLCKEQGVPLSYESYVDPFPRRQMINTDLEKCNELTVNAVDLVMGTDGILWVLDTGVTDTLDDIPVIEGHPKVVGLNVATGEVKHIISLQPFHHKTKSRYHYLVVEENNEGNTTMLFVGDSGTMSIIMWNVPKGFGSRMKLPRFMAESCTAVDPNTDVLYIALIEGDEGKELYLSYESSYEIYRIKTNNFRNRKCINPKRVVYAGTKPENIVFVGVGYGSVLYFRYNTNRNLYSWDTRKSLLEENWEIVRKGRDCRAATHVDVDNDGTLWVMESNLKDFVDGKTGCYGPSVLLYPVNDHQTAKK